MASLLRDTSLPFSFLLFERDCQLLLFTLAGSFLVNLVNFRDFLKLSRVVYLLAQEASLRDGTVSDLEDTVT